MDLHVSAGWAAVALTFAAFNLGSVLFFRPQGSIPLRLKLFLAIVPAYQIIALGWLLAFPPAHGWRQTALVVVPAISLAMFVATLVSARRQKFAPIFEGHAIAIAQRGAYGVVRHPFYTAYIFCYLGIAVAGDAAALTAGALALIGLYVHAAVAEERALTRGPHGAAYRRYCRETGRFMPRPRRRRRRVTAVAPLPLAFELSHTHTK